MRGEVTIERVDAETTFPLRQRVLRRHETVAQMALSGDDHPDAGGVAGRGIGVRVLAAVVDHVASRGGGLLWCNARLPAVAFYERGGFEARGDPWDEPHIGPHVAMWRRVSA